MRIVAILQIYVKLSVNPCVCRASLQKVDGYQSFHFKHSGYMADSAVVRAGHCAKVIQGYASVFPDDV
jgi:hypothetical protein